MAGDAVKAPAHWLPIEAYELVATWRGDAVVSTEPFEALSLPLGDLWAR